MHKKIALSIMLCTSLYLLCACAKKAQLDFQNLHSYSFNLEDGFLTLNCLKQPYAVSFKNNKNTLLFIASKHAVGLNSSTFQLIKEAFNAYVPDIVIIEGVDSAEGVSPSRLTKHIQTTCLPKWYGCGEIYYSIHLAQKRNIPVIGAEPSDSEIFDSVITQDYTKQDIVFFYFSQMIPQYYRQNQIKSKSDLIPLFNQFVAKYFDPLNYSFSDYSAWLKRKLGLDPEWGQLIDQNQTAPIENGQYLQKLSSNISIIRDKHILTLIFKMLDQGKNVMVVLGASHYPLQKDVLEQYLGRPSYHQKF
jgi:hypothetical protein